MALVKAKTAVPREPITYGNKVAAKIQQRRYQILVHSLLYYELDMNIVSDSQWAEWARELVDLQKSNPDIAAKVIFAKAFEDFDGSTGYNLPFRDEQIAKIAYRLLVSHGSAESADAIHRLRYEVSTSAAEYETYKKTFIAPAVQSCSKELNKLERKPRKGLFSVPRT